MRYFAAGAIVGCILFGSMLVQADGDPFVIAAIGEEDPVVQNLIESSVGREITVRPGPGHDGRMFFLQALDPFYQDEITAQTDRPLYRGQRLVYPLIAGLGGLLPLALIPWGMAFTHVVSFGLGTMLTARLATQRGLNPWWGFAFAANPGLWASIQIGAAGTTALALSVLGIYYAEQHRPGRAAAAMTACVLTREVMLLAVVGLAVQQWRKEGKLPVGLVAWPLAASAAWAGFLRFQITAATDAGVSTNLGLPGLGIVDSLHFWSTTVGGIGFALVTLVAVVAVVWDAVKRQDFLIGSVAPFAALFLVLTPAVLYQSFDYSRAIAPLFLGLGFVFADRLHAARTARLSLALT